MSDIIDRLQRARDMAWAALQPAFDHALALANEAEYEAARASNQAQMAIAPVYPPLVELLAWSALPMVGDPA